MVQRLRLQDYAVETPSLSQVDEIGDHGSGDPHFSRRTAWPVSGWSSSARRADWAIRELLARMTQRLQGCETIGCGLKVAERFAPNRPDGSPVNCVWMPVPWQMCSVAQCCRPRR